MSAAAEAMHKAVFAALAANPGIKAELGDPPRLYDDAPPGAAFPYAILGEGRTSPLAGLDGAVEHDIRIGIFSRHAGRAEIRRLIDAFYDALHEAAFAIEGHRLVGIRFVFADAFRRGPDDLDQGAVRFRAVTEIL